MVEINIGAFHLPQDGEDYAPACRRALEEAQKYGSAELYLEQGTYHVYDDTVEEFFSRICNNDSVMRKALFRICGHRKLTINGNGSLLITHGRLTPFVIDKCEDITIKNIAVDVQRPFYTQGKIVACREDELDLEIDQKQFPTRVRGTNFLFTSDRWECDGTFGTILVQEFDPKTMAPARDARTSLAAIGEGVQNTENLPVPLWRLQAYQLSDHLFRLKGNRTYDPVVGNTLVMTHEIRTVGGVLIFDSSNIKMENVSIYQSAAMPFLAQFSENITLDGCKVIPAPGSGRMISTNSDAAHFVHCTGTVRVENCLFESMMDDVVNVHGMYTVVRSVHDNLVRLDLIHYQQKGINMFRPGDTVIAHELGNFTETARETVLDSWLENDDTLVIRVASAAGFSAGNVCENEDRMPEVILRGNRGGKNRPRGFVVSSAKKMLIENNVLYNYQNCIDIPGDAKYWFETGGVRDVVIRNNIFIHHNAFQAVSAIKIKPDFDCPVSDYHRNILIENNSFFGNNPRLLDAACTDGLIFRGNTYTMPLVDETGMEVYRIRIKNCGKLQIQEITD